MPSRITICCTGDLVWPIAYGLLFLKFHKVKGYPRKEGTFSLARNKRTGLTRLSWIEREEAENGLVERLDESSPVSVASPGQN